MQSHIDDAENYLDMPVVFAEFGVSRKDPGYKGGSCFLKVQTYMDDGYAIVLSKAPSMSNINPFSPPNYRASIPCVLGNADGDA